MDGQPVAQESQALTVSAAMALAKGALEGIVITIIGEVSEVSIKPGYKAAYFTVKDSSAALPCMMWNNRYKQAGFDLAVGQLVELTGRFTLYAAKGRMNFDVFTVSLSGEGRLRMQVAAIAKKLASEGLTNPERKRPIPKFPERIGLVTSPRSAVVHDVLRTMRRRFPVAEVVLAGVPVEGVNAAAGIIEGLRCVVSAGVEVVLVVRGGGSFEDLMPFNDEALARAIAACPVPVVTGIGHEVDTSIADMVSDMRASTPTAAAEAVSPARENLEAYFASRGAALYNSNRMALDRMRAQIDRVSSRPMFEDPMLLFSAEAQALDNASGRLERALPLRLERTRNRLDMARVALIQKGSALLAPFDRLVGVSAARLEDLSPLSILGRGYAIARDEEGSLVKSVHQVKSGDALSVAVSDGNIECRVE